MCTTSWTEYFQQWVPSKPTWLRLPTQNDASQIWNKLKAYYYTYVQQKDAHLSADKIIANIRNEEFTTTNGVKNPFYNQSFLDQITYLETKKTYYPNRSDVQTALNTKIKDVIDKALKKNDMTSNEFNFSYKTALDMITFLNDIKELPNISNEIYQFCTNEIKSLESEINKAKTDIERREFINIEKTRMYKTKIKNLYEEYSTPPKQVTLAKTIDPRIKLAALNEIVVDFLKKNIISPENVLSLRSKSDLFATGLKTTSIIQALAEYNSWLKEQEQTKEEYTEQPRTMPAKSTPTPEELEKARKTLGLSAGASESEIKSAFKKLARIWHPDKNPGHEDEANKKMQEINAAHDALLPKQNDEEYNVNPQHG